MPLFWPLEPIPSNTSMPAVLDPSLRFSVDSGYELRRPRHSRPRRFVQLEYRNLATNQIRIFRDFLMFHRLSVTPFAYQNIVTADLATVSNTTPVVLTLYHIFMTGQWVGVTNAFHPSLNGFWQITRLDPVSFALNGSAAVGTGTCRVHMYFPYAIGHFPEDRMESPVKYIGPETTDNGRARFALNVQIEEVF